MTSRRRLFHLFFGTLASLALAGALQLSASFMTDSYDVHPDAINQGGDAGITFDSYTLDGSVGEVGTSSTTFDSFELYSGYSSMGSYPSAIIDLTSVEKSSTTMTLAWTAPGSDGGMGALESGSSYRIEYSTDASHEWDYLAAQITISTSNVNPGDPQSVLVTGLPANTTHYIHIWTLDPEGNISPISNEANDMTRAASVQLLNPAFLNVYFSSITARWLSLPASPSSATSSGYALQASTASNFTGTLYQSSTTLVSQSTLTVTGLNAGDLYYFRVVTYNTRFDETYTSLGSTQTRTDSTPPAGVSNLSAAALSSTTIRLQWSAPSDPTNSPLNGTYRIQYSTWSGVTWLYTNAQISFSTSSVTAGASQAYPITGLSANTTYFIKLWTGDSDLNWSTESNQAADMTWAQPLQNVVLVQVNQSSASISWTTLPASPSTSSATGYRVEASTASNFSGTLTTSSTTNLNLDTLSLTGLHPNTSYYMRARSINANGVGHASDTLAAPTKATPPVRMSTDFLNVYYSSITARWAAKAVSPSSASSYGYQLEASSTDFDGTADVFFSSTTNVALSTLTITGLSINTTYYFRVASLNFDGVFSYTTLTTTSTLTNPPLAVSDPLLNVAISSVTAQWDVNSNPSETNFVVHFATMPNFGGLPVVTVATETPAAITSLTPNTTYFARVKSVNWSGVSSAYLDLGSTVTFANPPVTDANVFSPVYYTSFTVNFTSGIPANPVDTRYTVEISTNEDYSFATSSNSFTLSVSSTGLQINTTFYVRARALARNGIYSNYTEFGSSATLAVMPGVSASTFSNVLYSSFDLNWSSGSAQTGYNPDTTLYQVQISLVSNFASILDEQFVTGIATTFDGLISNTAYYARVRALNHQFVPTDYRVYGTTTTVTSARPSFLNGTFEVSNSQGVFIDPSLYTDTTTPQVRVQVHSNVAPGLAVADTPAMKAIWHLDEGQRYISQDASRHGFTMGLGPAGAANKPTWVPGQIGTGLDFNGTTAFSTSTALTGFRANAANNIFTTELWFKAGATDDQGIVFSNSSVNTNNNNSGTADNQFGWYTGTFRWRMENTGGTGTMLNSAQALDDNNWHYAAGVVSASGIHFYIDGVFRSSSNAITSANAMTYATVYGYLGSTTRQDGAQTSRFYAGQVDEVRISTVAMSASQIAANYSWGRTHGIGLGAPHVDISTRTGTDFTWVRTSTASQSISGTVGTTSAQTFVSTLSLSGVSLRQTDSPGDDTNRVMFIASSLDANVATAQYTILVDTTPPTGSAMSTFTDVSTTSLTAFWSTATDPLSGLASSPYNVEASTSVSYSPKQVSGFIALSSTSFASLLPNTTYFFHVQAQDAAGNVSSFSSNLSTMTLAKSLENISIQAVYSSSATFLWSALDVSPSSESASGYLLQASTSNFDGLSPVYFSSNTNVLQSSLTVTGLSANTTYFFRVASLNAIGSPNFSTVFATSTLTSKPALTTVMTVYASSITVNWQAASGSVAGYQVDASTASDFSTAVHSSQTYVTSLTTLTVQNLSPNATMYIRVGALNWNNIAQYASGVSTVTLTNPPSAFAFVSIYSSSITASWSAPSGGAAGYRLEASTNSNYANSLVSSVTYAPGQTQLTVFNLISNATHFFRVAALNLNNVAVYNTTTATSTLASAPLAPSLMEVNISSIAVSWTLPAEAAEAYRVEAATSSDFLGTIRSSESYVVNLTTLTVENLNPNTTYYLRVAGISDHRPNYSSQLIAPTRANAPNVPTPTDIYVSSITASWSVPSGGANGFRFEVSPNEDFSAPLISSDTIGTDVTSLTTDNLDPNTTYYMRVGALNHAGLFSYSDWRTTGTLANIVNVIDVIPFVSSITVTWDQQPFGARGFRVQASANPNFTNPVFSSTTFVSDQTYLTVGGLTANTSYYVRVGALNHNNVPNNSLSFDTSTLANLPIGPHFISVHVSSASVGWTVPFGIVDGYRLEASTSVDFAGIVKSSDSYAVYPTTLTVIDLVSEATYFFRIGTLNNRSVPNFITLGSTITHVSIDIISPDPVADLIATAVDESQMLLQWTAPLDPTDVPLTGTYSIQYSTWTGVEWSTANAQVSFSTAGVSMNDPQSRVVPGLTANTTHYFKVWIADLRPNWSAESNQAARMTKPVPLESVQFSQVNRNDVSVSWNGLPLSPQALSARGYRLEAATDPSFASVVAFASSTALSQPTLTTAGLSPNTTYYFRAGSFNLENAVNYSAALTTSTLSLLPVRIPPDYLSVQLSSITVRWAAFPLAPSSASAQGFWLEASSNNFDGSDTIVSSRTSSVAISTLTVDTLQANTTYYFRVGSLNHNNVASYTTLPATSTLSNPISIFSVSDVYASSTVVTWTTPSYGAAGFQLEASSTNFNGTGAVLFSSTTNGADVALTVAGLTSNTTYHFRVGTLNWNRSLTFSSSIATATLAVPPTRNAPDYISTSTSAITVGWLSLPLSPASASSFGFRLQASSTNFDGTGTVYSSTTISPLISTLTIAGLSSNTTYYFRVGSLNWNQMPNWTVLPGTSTLANRPLGVASTFTAVSITSMTIDWNTSVNPAGTIYQLQLSTDSLFGVIALTTTTTATPITVTGLNPNTTYFALVQAVNWNGVYTSALNLGSTVTLTNGVSLAAVTFDPVNVTSFTVNYSSGVPPNSPDTLYTLDISTDAGFATFTSSSSYTLQVSSIGLQINTTYYARGRATSGNGIVSGYTDFGSTATLTVPPSVVDSTFSNVTSNSFDLNWSSGSASTGYNPADTLYHVQISLVSNFASVLDEQTVEGLSTVFGGLVSNTQYYARVRSLNRYAVPSAYFNYGSTTTVTSAIPSFINGTFEVSDAQGNYISASQYTNTLTPSIRVQVQSNAAPGLAVTDTPSMKAGWHFDESNVLYSIDFTKHNYTMGFGGTTKPTRVAGVIGSGLDFNGTTAFSTTTALTGYRNNATNNVFTTEIWFKAGATDDQGIVYSNSSVNTNTNNSGTADNQFGWFTGTFRWRMETTGGVGTSLNSAQALDNNAWHYAAGVVGTGGIHLYIDGVFVSSSSAITSANAMTYPTVYGYLGSTTRQDGAQTSRFYAGQIDEVRISSVALSASEIARNYAWGQTHGIMLGAPHVDISTQSGADFTWVRTSTASQSITGTNGITSAQIFTSSLTAAGISLRQTSSPGADTNRAFFIASSLGSNVSTGQYTILVDTTPPAGAAIDQFTNISTTALTVFWTSASDSLSGLASSPYEAEASTTSSYSPKQASGYIGLSSTSFSGLMPNTTYYFHVRSKDVAGNESTFSVDLTTITLSKPVQDVALAHVHIDSVTVSWTALAVTPSSESARGYLLEASTQPFDGTGLIYFSSNTNVVNSSLSITGLSPNTTYFFRVGSINGAGVPNYSDMSSTATLTNAPSYLEVVSVDVSSMTASWSAPPGGVSGYRLDASSNSNFEAPVYSSMTYASSLTTLTVENLDANTTYYLRVAGLNWNDRARYSETTSSSTLAIQVTPLDPDVLTVYRSSMTVQWTAMPPTPANLSAEGYRLEASSTNFNGTGTVFVTSTTDISQSVLSVQGLTVNTTYYLRVASLNGFNMPNYRTLSASSTLTNTPIAPHVVRAFISSATVTWSFPSGTVKEYWVEASTTSDFSSDILSSHTTNVQISSLTILSLLSSTTYYFRVAGVNWNGLANYAFGGSTTTRSSTDVIPPYPIDSLAATALSESSMLLMWNAPVDPTNSPLSGMYFIQHATWTGVVWSTNNAQVNIATSAVVAGTPQSHVVTALDPNTTHYFHMWTQDIRPNLSDISIQAVQETLANLPANFDFAQVWETSSTLSWTALPTTPSSSSARGYTLQASLSSDFGAIAASSTTYLIGQSQLQLIDLDENTTYYFRVGSVNIAYEPNFSVTIATSQLTRKPARLTTDVIDVSPTSLTARWLSYPASPQNQSAMGYRLEASSTNFTDGTIYMSSTTDISLSTLTVHELSPNVTYYLRIGALNASGIPNYTLLNTTSSLANAPSLASTTFPDVYVSSLTVMWDANSNSGTTLYTIQISSVLGFGQPIHSSTTSLLTYSFSSLLPNTTYYARAKATNHNGLDSIYTDLGSTMTLTSPPLPATPVFSLVNVTSFTVSYTSGTPTNPDDTTYVLELSTYSDFSFATFHSTNQLSYGFIGLEINTAYYVRIRARNNLSWYSSYTDLGSTTTLTVLPGVSDSTFTSVNYNAFDVNWSSGSTVTGYNPDGTSYHAQISLTSNFASIYDEQTVQGLAASFGGLVPNTAYYVRVRSVNGLSVPSGYVDYGSTTTLVSSIPSFILGSFEVSNAQGQFISPSLYTNTTTPVLRVQVQSNGTPGLAVTDTPAMKAVWHLDEGTTLLARDSSRHNFNFGLGGTVKPTWVTGLMGSALDFDGANAFSTSTALSGLRSNAANNVFTTELWFKAGATDDQGIVYSNSSVNTNTNNSGVADNQFGWFTTTFRWRMENTGAVATTLNSNQILDDNNWHYAAGVVSGSGLYLYIDGVFVSSSSAITSANAMTYATVYGYLGSTTRQDGAQTSRFFAGSVDEVRISTIAMTAAQIASSYGWGRTHGIGFGAPHVDISTQSGTDFSWVRLSTTAQSISGTAGTTSAQTFTSSISASGYSLRETASPASDTNRIMFIASSLDANVSTGQYTILVDTTPPSGASMTTFTDVSTTSLTAFWSTATDPLSGLASSPYNAESSTSVSYSPKQTSGYIGLSSTSFSSLLPNTTYFFHVQAKDEAGNESAFSSNLSTMTLAKPVQNISIQAVYSSSATFQWSALLVSPSSESASGYLLQASSTNFDGLSPVFFSSNTSVLQSSLTVTGLTSNTTYFFRVAALNAIGSPNFSSAYSTSTLTQIPTQLSLVSVQRSSITVTWTAPAGTVQGYRVQMSTHADFSAAVSSSQTYVASLTTLTVSNLDSNTTYYIRVGALNHNNVASYTGSISTATWSLPPTGLTLTSVYISSISATWTPASGGATGYRLDASTNANFATPLYSSTTYISAQNALTVENLSPNTTYFLRVAALNQSSVAQFSDSTSTSTLTNPAIGSHFVGVYLSSITVSWSIPVGGAEGYRLDASTDPNFQTAVHSSETYVVSLTTLTISNLDSNTTYYLRVGAANWNHVYRFATPIATTTYTGAPTSLAFRSVFISSITATWSAPSGGVSGYRLEASTASDFTGTVSSSVTYVVSLTTLTVQNLNPNTTYFVRVAAMNPGNGAQLGTERSTSTLTNPPVAPTLVNIFLSSASISWSTPAGSAAGYRLEASAAADFSTIDQSSTSYVTTQSTLSVVNLDANTTYYFRVAGLNWNNVAMHSISVSSSTRANAPTRIPPDVLAVYASSMTVRWAAAPAAPSNLSAEGYRLEASSTNFNGTDTITSSITTNIAVSTLTLNGLLANTTYYLRVASLNGFNVPSYENLSATSTLAGAPIGPHLVNVYFSSITVSWSLPANGAADYMVEASTQADMTGAVISTIAASVSISTLTVETLTSDTTYYLRVSALNWNSQHSYATTFSTKTRISVDAVAPAAVTDLAASVVSNTSLALTWTSPLDTTNNPLSGTYFIQHATWTGVVWSTTVAQVSIATTNVAPGIPQGTVLAGLDPNTTYYFRLWTADIKPNVSPLSNGATVATLANAPTNFSFMSVWETSATLNWTAFPVTPSSASTYGLVLEASLSSNFGAIAASSTSYIASQSELTLTGLSRNTSYYFRIGSLNASNLRNYASMLSTATLTNKPTRLATDYFAVYPSSITARWLSYPSSPQAESALAYRLEASSTNFTDGSLYFSSTTNLGLSTMSITGLDKNVVYYVRVGALNLNEVPNYTQLTTTSTLASAPLASIPSFTGVFTSSLTMAWQANSNSASTVYTVEVSTMDDFSGSISSDTTTALSLSIQSLTPSTTYFARVKATNNDGVPTVYLSLNSTMTLPSAPGAGSPVFSPVYVTSFTVNITHGSPANQAGTIYTVDVSTESNFASLSSSTGTGTAFPFTSLSINTTYYARVKTQNALGVSTPFTDLGSTVTLAVQPGPAVSTFTSVGNREFILNWSAGTIYTGSNPDLTLYVAQISTASDFSGSVDEKQTTDLTASYTGLNFGTQYYARIKAVNHLGVSTPFRDYESVSTLPSSEPEFVIGTFEVTNAAGSYIDPLLYTDTTTVNVRVQVQSTFAPGLSVTDTPSQIGLWRMDEGAGASVVDSSLHSHPLTLTGAPAPTWTTGKFSNALVFDGSQNYALTPNLTPWRKSASDNSWTVEMWFKTGTNVGYLFQAANVNTGSPTVFDLDIGWHNTSGNLVTTLRTTGGVQKIADSGSSFADGNWHMVTAVLNGAGLYIYVDGAPLGSNTTINSSTARTYPSAIYGWIGAASILNSNVGNGSRFSAATIDEVRISTVGFTAAQVSQSYQLSGVRGVTLGGPQIHYSTHSGHDFTWIRLSTAVTTITGTNGTTSVQTFTGTGLSVVDSTFSTLNQVMFVASSLDGNITTAQFSIRVDTAAPQNVGIASFTAVTTGQFTINLLTALDSASGLPATPYSIRISTDNTFDVFHSSTDWIAGPSATFTQLSPNTTYFVQVKARDVNSNTSAYSSSVATMTLAHVVTDLQATIYRSSITYTWSALPSSPSTATAAGYTLQLSTHSDFSTLILSSATPVTTATWSPQNLTPENTYFFRVASLNNIHSPNYSASVSTQITAYYSIELSTDTLYFGSLLPGATVVYESSITVTNTGNIATTFRISVEQPAIWVATTSVPYFDNFRLTGLLRNTQPDSSDFDPANDAISDVPTAASSSVFAVTADSASEKGFNVAPNETRVLWIRIEMPRISTTDAEQVIRLNATAGP